MQKRIGILITIVLICMLIDMCVKHYVHTHNLAESSFLFGLVKISATTNMGVAFSIFSGSKMATVLPVIALIICIAVAIINKQLLIPMALIAGGGMSNHVERLYFGYVYDFIKIQIPPVYGFSFDDLFFFPVFNMADIFVTVGVMMVIIMTIRGWRRS